MWRLADGLVSVSIQVDEEIFAGRDDKWYVFLSSLSFTLPYDLPSLVLSLFDCVMRTNTPPTRM
jgi:hypothetical protein